ncbi:B12-binding domain-containing radical SAM protein [Streptomyces neyagawaensis]|uniref:B12-binding domain-containing radical SAM protein n=1 Tax=Streptomyces neyagawaensis TaxID=42238 RepID=UPI000A5D7C3B|nr:radical SAM protein [Streptomyces neyagawaensis]MCL6736495.1 radical SAM protein [Streptomyces neyagawaensis]MDE1680889.1 radical SAM protein [Streptomyces neyagawaensis]
MNPLRLCLVVPADPVDRCVVRVPLDVLAAAAGLRADGHEVTVWDQRLPDTPPVMEDPDLLVVFTAAVGRARRYPLDLAPVRAATDRARRWFPGAPTMAVGPHGTHLPGATLLDLAVDHVAVGEAGSATVHGVRDLGAGIAAPVLYGDLPRPAAPVTVVGNHPRPYPDLDQDRWPMPAYDLVPLERYTAEVVVDGVPRPGPAGTVLATHDDTCGHPPFGAVPRTRSVDRVVAEVAAQRAAGLPSQSFLDSVFGIDTSYYGMICERLRGQGIDWVARTSTEAVLRTDVTRWAEAGCRGMWLRAEPPSGDDAGQPFRDAVLKLRDAGITPFASVLIGLPGDAVHVPDRLVDWAAELPARFALDLVSPRPGTPLYSRLAPGLNGGTPPATWQEVRHVTRRYRAEYPADLDDLERRLTALPNHLADATALTG